MARSSETLRHVGALKIRIGYLGPIRLIRNPQNSIGNFYSGPYSRPPGGLDQLLLRRDAGDLLSSLTDLLCHSSGWFSVN